MQTITILGSTGSIGCSTLDVIQRHPDKYRVFAITGHTQVELLIKQAKVCSPRYVVLADDSGYEQAKSVNDFTPVLRAKRTTAAQTMPKT